MGLGLLSGVDWGKVGGKSDGSRGSYGPLPRPSCFHTQDFSKTNDGSPKTWGLRSGAAESSEDLDGWHSAQVTPQYLGNSPPGAPPAETPNAKLYHGCHAKLPEPAWPSPRLRRIIRPHQGFYTIHARISHWSVPATTAASVEPHIHHRRLSHAWDFLAPGPHGKMDALSSTVPA